MQEFQVGDLVCSAAGRDKDSFYIIVKMEGDFLYLADGKYKLVDKPKKKRKKHSVLVKRNRMEDVCTDLQIKRMLKQYVKKIAKIDLQS